MTPCCQAVGGRLSSEALDALNADLRGGMSVRKAAAKHGQPYANVQRHAAAGHHCPDSGESEPTQGAENHPDSFEESGIDSPVSAQPSLYAVPNPGDDPPTAPRKVITALVERRCVDLRAAGKSYVDIAADVGISEDNAVDVVERVLLRTVKGTDARADAARALDVERIERLLAGVWERATSPGDASDPEGGYSPSQDKAVERVTKLLERRAKLLGLDAPTVTVSLDHPKVKEELNRAVGDLYELLKFALRPHPAALADVVAAMRQWRSDKGMA